ncbi:MAG: hypothetical protein ABJB47_22525, partial [Actinomycetota bacterium]
AALLYAVAAVLLWPRRPDATTQDAPTQETEGAPADAGLLGGRGARWCWVIVWAGMATLELGSANHDPRVPAGEASGIAAGEPGWVAAINHHAGQLLAGRGVAFAIVTGVVQLAIAVAVLHRRSRRTALAAGLLLAVLYGIAGQDFGGLLTGQATDPGTAPLLVLLALALWPRRTLPSGVTPSELPQAG